MCNGKIIDKCKNYGLNEETIDNLINFFEKKNKYINESTNDNRVNMITAYEEIYNNLKHAMYMNIIKQTTFYELVEEIQEGL